MGVFHAVPAGTRSVCVCVIVKDTQGGCEKRLWTRDVCWEETDTQPLIHRHTTYKQQVSCVNVRGI